MSDMGHVMAQNGVFGPGFVPSDYQKCRNCGESISRMFYGDEWTHDGGYVTCDFDPPVAEPVQA